jgi:hypothetical protein
MAVARAFIPADMPSLEVWRGDITTATTDEIIISDGFRATVYSGQFSYDLFGRVSGILSSVDEFREGTQIYSVTDINVDASQVYDAIQVDGDARLAAQLILSGEDVMEGSEGADYLRGYAENDVMSGFVGNDTLDGGAGDDTLMGGAGEDTYVFEAAWGQDVIADGDLSGGLRFVDRAAEDLTFADDGGDLVIADDENSVRVIDYYLNGASYDFAFAGTGGGGGGWSITPSNGLIAEGSGAVALTITRPDPTREATKYVNTTQDQGAANNGDYVGKLNEPLTFAAGEREKTISVDILQDEAPEADETFGVIVQDDPADPIEINLASTTFTIQDDDGAAPGNSPTVSGDTTQTIDVSTSINGTELVSAADVDGDLAFVRFSDATAGTDGGTLTFDGTPISGSFVDVAPADLSRVAYQAGPNGGSNEITVEAFDEAGNDSEDLTITFNVSAPDVTGEIGRAVQGVVYLSSTTGELYTWDPDSDDVDLVGDTTVALTDLALAPDGTLYGISTTDLYRVDAETAEAFRVGPLAGDLFFGTDALTDAQGFDIGPDGAARISSGNNSVVAVVDLLTGAVSNPFGPSLRQTETSSGDLWFAQDDRYFVTTNSSVLLTIAPSTFGEGIADNDFISNDDIEGLVSLAKPGADQRADLIGFSGNAYYSLAEGALPALPGLELGTLAVGGAITGAALSRADVGAPNQAPDLNLNQSLVILEGETEVYDFEATDDTDTEGDGLLYSTTGGADQDAFVIDALTGELRLKFPAEASPFGDADGDGVYELTVQVADSGGIYDALDLFVQVVDFNSNPVEDFWNSSVLPNIEFFVSLDQIPSVLLLPALEALGLDVSNFGLVLGDAQASVVDALERVYFDSDLGRELITEYFVGGRTLQFLNSPSGTEIRNATAFNDTIFINFDDIYYISLSGSFEELSLERKILHELVHLARETSDLVDRNGSDIRSFSDLTLADLSDGSVNLIGETIPIVNASLRQLGEVDRIGYSGTFNLGEKENLEAFLSSLPQGIDGDFDQLAYITGFKRAGVDKIDTSGVIINGLPSDDLILWNPPFEADASLGEPPSEDSYYEAQGWINGVTIVTGAGDDFVIASRAIGFAGGDRILLGAGNDKFYGLEGDDEIDAGEGLDQAFYRNSIVDYTVSLNSFGQIVIDHDGLGQANANDGTDKLTDVEQAVFNDAVLDLASVSNVILMPGETASIRYTVDDFDGITVREFNGGDTLEFVNVNFDERSLTVTYGSAILDVDVDLDGEIDATVTLLGDFEGAQFNVEVIGADTQITVEFPPENNPPVANADSYSLRPNGVLNVSAALGLLANDSDPDGDALRIASVSNPVNGTVALDDKDDADPNNDEVVFTPATGFSGAAAFDYTVSDGFGGAATATVAVDVTGAPDVIPTVTTGTDGDDIILTLVGGDRIVLGGGEDIVRGPLESFFDDMIEDFGLDDMLLFEDSRITRDAIDVTFGSAVFDVDGDGDGNVDGSFTLEGDFSSGDFMAVIDSSDTAVTFETFLPMLQEGQAVNPGLVNGILNQEFLRGDGSTDFQVTLRDLGFAGYDNVVGVYEINTSGSIVDARILFTNANADKSAVATVTDVEAGHNLGFFIVQDAADWAVTLATGDALSFINSTGAAANISDGADISIAVDGAAVDEMVFHSFAETMNSDGMQHSLSGVEVGGKAISVGFEDLTGGGDRDYEDVVFRVEQIDDIFAFA